MLRLKADPASQTSLDDGSMAQVSKNRQRQIRRYIRQNSRPSQGLRPIDHRDRWRRIWWPDRLRGYRLRLYPQQCKRRKNLLLGRVFNTGRKRINRGRFRGQERRGSWRRVAPDSSTDRISRPPTSQRLHKPESKGSGSGADYVALPGR